MNLVHSYNDERLKMLLLETLNVFKRLNENVVNLIVTIFHFSGEVDAGDIGFSQGDPYSLKWEAIISELIQKNWVGIEQKGYREYFLKKDYDETSNYEEILVVLKKKSYNDVRKVALNLMKNNQTSDIGISGLKSILNVQRVCTTAT